MSLLPLAIECFSKWSLTTGAYWEFVQQHDACPVSRSPDAHVWIPHHTVHGREIRTERLHMSSQLSDRGFHGTVALQRMTKFRSCALVFVSPLPAVHSIRVSLVHRRSVQSRF